MARKKPEVADLSTKLLLVELGSEKRWKRLAVIGALSAGALGGLAFGVMRVLDSRDTAARDAAWSSLNACLLGDPLKDGETPMSRISNIQLGILGVPMEKRSKTATDPAWPAACAVQAFALQEHAGSTPLGDAAKALAGALKTDATATADLRAQVEPVYREAAALKLEAKPSADTTPAPKPAAPLFSNEAFRALPKFLSGTFSLSSVRDVPSSGQKIHFLIDQHDMPEGPVLCTATAADPSVHCLKIPPAVATLSPGLRLVGTTEDSARPFYFAGDRGQLGIFPPEGRGAIDAGVTLGASAHADGSIALLLRRDTGKDVRLVVHPATGLAIERSLLQPTDLDPAGQIGLSWDWITYRGPAKAGAPSHLFARKIEGPPGAASAALDLGEIDEPAPADKADKETPIVACRTDEGMSVRVRGARVDTLALFAGGRWGAPVKLSTRGGALTCRGIEAVTTSIEHAIEADKDYATISQSRCNSSGCTPISVPLKQLLAGVGEIVPADASGIVATDVGGKLAILWNGGPLGGLRMRFGAADRMKEAPDTIVADGREGAGEAKLSSFVGLKVLPGNGFSVVLVNTTSGVKAFRLDGEGHMAALQATL
ncbi:MAG: hypothetical protein ABJE95_24965 [Byssovorax sp.]